MAHRASQTLRALDCVVLQHHQILNYLNKAYLVITNIIFSTLRQRPTSVYFLSTRRFVYCANAKQVLFGQDHRVHTNFIICLYNSLLVLVSKRWKRRRNSTSIVVKCKHQLHFVQLIHSDNWWQTIVVINQQCVSQSCALLITTVDLNSGIKKNGKKICEQLQIESGTRQFSSV